MGCKHVELIKDVKPRSKGCEECMRTGQKWKELRVCKICGHVGCCDSSPGKHATAHFHYTNHPIVQTMEAGENWYWCYVDKVMMLPD